VLLTPYPTVVVVDNIPGPVTGPQRLPLCPAWRLLLGLVPGKSSPRCDWVTYDGSPPLLDGHPQPAVRGTTMRTAPLPADLYVERPVPTFELLEKSHQFYQTAGGHVVAMPFNTRGGGDKYEQTAAPFVDRMPVGDGPRNVAMLTAYTTGVVHP